MKLVTSRTAAGLAVAAALSLSAAPAFAHGGWGHDRHYHDGGVDAGDVFAGLLLIGGIAAIASAASNANRASQDEARYPEPDYRAPPPAYAAPGDGAAYAGAAPTSGLDEALDRCLNEIERGDRRVGSVDSVARDGDGWRVDGRMEGGSDFTCAIDEAGHIRRVAVDGHAL